MITFMISVKVAVPLLARGGFLASMVPSIAGMTLYRPRIGLVSMAVVDASRIILVTEILHVLSVFLYLWL